MKKLFRVWNKRDETMSEPFTLEDMYQAGVVGLHRKWGEEDYEVMEFIHRKDDEDEEICESDIVKVTIDTIFEEVEKIGIVEYMDSPYNAWGIDFPNAGVTITFSDPSIGAVEKIGTIYENPKLYKSLCGMEEDK